MNKHIVAVIAALLITGMMVSMALRGPTWILVAVLAGMCGCIVRMANIT